MRERDLQDYLFANPHVLFPNQAIEEKAREFAIDGKRIDLLFKVEGVRFIVELKAVPLQREHVGQVTEYYGRMRRIMKEQQLRMILVAPSIPDYRKVFLEELGIRCVEIDSIPTSNFEVEKVQKVALSQQKAEKVEGEISSILPPDAQLSFEDVGLPVSKHTLAFSHRVLRDSLDTVRKDIPGYELCPVKMARADSPDVYCGREPFLPSSDAPIAPGGAWWAYSFGHAEEMPKNDIPNVSVLMMPWGLDVTINSEIKASQIVLMEKIRRYPTEFDRIVSDHGGLWLQTWLKLEHQPRFYHWIPKARLAPGQWDSRHLVDHHREVEDSYSSERAIWLDWIQRHRPELSPKQTAHLEKGSKNLNLAIRLVAPFHQGDPLWEKPYPEQLRMIEAAVCHMRPLVEFFTGRP